MRFVLRLRHEVDCRVCPFNRQLEGVARHFDALEERQDGIVLPRLLPDLLAPEIRHPFIAEAGLRAICQLIGFCGFQLSLANLVCHRLGITLADTVKTLRRAQQHIAVQHIHRIQRIELAADLDTPRLECIALIRQWQTFARRA